MTKEKQLFDIKDRGFSAKGFYIKDSSNALVEIFKGEKLYRSFLFPAYKIWNIPVHFSDIVDGELKNSDEGYYVAGDTGFGGNVMKII